MHFFESWRWPTRKLWISQLAFSGSHRSTNVKRTLLIGMTVMTTPMAAWAQDCPTVTLDEPGLRLDSPTWSDHENACLLTGEMAEYEGQDGNAYVLRFEIALPQDWNGGFVHQFNGGVDGFVAPARGGFNVADPSQTALSRRYAIVSSDAGHAIDAHPDQGLQGPTRFGFDARARANYGHAAVATLDPVARRIVEAAYGAPIQHAYGIGRSNGGRHAMVAAARMPEAFDGLLIGYPGFNLPKAAIQHAWDTQIFHGLTGDVRTAFTQTELDAVATYILDRCDALDGLEDGMIFDMRACQAVLGAVTPAELTPQKAEALEKIMDGPRTSLGTALYSDWYWDAGINSDNWRQWKLEGTAESLEYMPRIVALGAGSLAQVFSTPPVELGPTAQDMLDYLLAYDFDHDPTAIATTTDTFPESGLDAMLPPDLDFTDFRAAGGKMIVFHGLSDPVFSAKDTVNWFRDTPRADSYARLYLVPNMPHGHSPAAPDDFDLLSALVNWVERGTAPGAVLAATRPDHGEGVSRLLCPYPQITTYVADDPDRATSFSCRGSMQ